MFKHFLSVCILLSLALVTLAEVTAVDIQNTEAQLRDLIQKMETDQLNYDL